MDNATRKELLYRARAAGYPGSILDVYANYDQGRDLIADFQAQQRHEQMSGIAAQQSGLQQAAQQPQIDMQPQPVAMPAIPSMPMAAPKFTPPQPPQPIGVQSQNTQIGIVSGQSGPNQGRAIFATGGFTEGDPPDWRNILNYKYSAPVQQNLVGNVRKVESPTAVPSTTFVKSAVPTHMGGKTKEEVKATEADWKKAHEEQVAAEKARIAQENAELGKRKQEFAKENLGVDISQLDNYEKDANGKWVPKSEHTKKLEADAKELSLNYAAKQDVYRKNNAPTIGDELTTIAKEMPLALLGTGIYSKALGAIGEAALPAVRTISTPFARGASNFYNKVATGNSIIPYAWKSPAAGLSEEASAEMFNSLLNNSKLIPAERAIVTEYQHNSWPFTGRFGTVDPTKQKALNDIITKYQFELPENSNVIATRRFNSNKAGTNTLGAKIEGNKISFGDRPTSFSVGVGPEGYGGAPDRLVIPSRHLKGIKNNFLLNEYAPLSQEELALFPEGNLKEFASKIGTNPNLVGERELIGTGLDFKQIGKVKNDIGGFDYIAKPLKVPNTKFRFKFEQGGPLPKAQTMGQFQPSYDTSKSVAENIELNKRARAAGWNSVAEYEKAKWGYNTVKQKQQELLNNPEAQKFAVPVENKDQLHANKTSGAQKAVNQVYNVLSNPVESAGHAIKYGYVPQGNLGNYGHRGDADAFASTINDFVNPFAWGNAAYRFSKDVTNKNSYTTGMGALNMGADLAESLPFFGIAAKTMAPGVRAFAEHPLVNGLHDVAADRKLYGPVYAEALASKAANSLTSPFGIPLYKLPGINKVYKNAAYAVGSQSHGSSRSIKQIRDAIFKQGSKGEYTGGLYGSNDQNLLQQYIYGNAENFEPSSLPQRGLTKYSEKYGPLDNFKLKMTTPEDEAINFFDIAPEEYARVKWAHLNPELAHLDKMPKNTPEQILQVQKSLEKAIQKKGVLPISRKGPVGKRGGYTDTDIAGHTMFLVHDPATGKISSHIQDIWKFTPDDYAKKWGVSKAKTEYLDRYKIYQQAKLMEKAGKPFVLHGVRPFELSPQLQGKPMGTPEILHLGEEVDPNAKGFKKLGGAKCYTCVGRKRRV